MSKPANIYQLERQQSEKEMTLIFVSHGIKDIPKAVQYSFVLQLENFPIRQLKGKMIYNFGFGDYDKHSNTIADDVNSNNGDVYKIFNTVLSTVHIFFENHINDALVVQGSDEGSAFSKLCKVTCSKKCKAGCKKQSRRIKIYRNYIDKNYNSLIADYHFFGGKKNKSKKLLLEQYECGREYSSILLIKKT